MNRNVYSFIGAIDCQCPSITMLCKIYHHPFTLYSTSILFYCLIIHVLLFTPFWNLAISPNFLLQNISSSFYLSIKFLDLQERNWEELPGDFTMNIDHGSLFRLPICRKLNLINLRYADWSTTKNDFKSQVAYSANHWFAE